MAVSARLGGVESGSAMTTAAARMSAARAVSGTRKAGLIINPKSGKSNGKGLALAGMMTPSDGVSVKVMDRFSDLRPHLEALGADGVTDLFISSGDGTAQAILTEIAERNPFSVLPRLSFLPHGTTNLSGPDVGFRSRSFAAQAHMLRNLGAKDIAQRATVRCVNCGDGEVRHGMFVGTGAVAQATLFCQQAFNSKGVKGSYATFATLAGAIGKALFSAPAPNDPTRLDRPYPISISADGRRVTEGNQLLIMATTLETLILGTKPFWNKSTGAIRCTTIPYPVPSLVRWTLTVMYGGENRRTPPGCHSFTAGSAEISSQSMFVIDGEFFDAPQDGVLQIETGPLFQFIRG